jgi:hypothetical protein
MREESVLAHFLQNGEKSRKALQSAAEAGFQNKCGVRYINYQDSGDREEI